MTRPSRSRQKFEFDPVLFDPRFNPHQDEAWARDWQAVTEVFEAIDGLKHAFEKLDTNYLMKLTEKQLLLNLKRYAWTLQNVFIERYKDEDARPQSRSRSQPQPQP